MIIDAQLVAEAMQDIKPFDQNGEMAKRINDLKEAVETANAAGRTSMSRGSMALLITGEPDVCAVLARAWAKALQGCGIVAKNNEGGPRIETMNWPGELEDICAHRQLIERSWAEGKMSEAQKRAAEGVLVIPDIHRTPYLNWPDDGDSGPKARDGALWVLSSFMSNATNKKAPVVILTGEAEPMEAFLAENPIMQQLFDGKSIAACTVSPDITTALTQPLTIRSPLRLKPPSFSRF
jgi:hypothetical protein